MLEYLQRDPLAFLRFMLYRAPAVLLALTLHEIAHGYMALRAGDPTARDLGRLSLNPLRHLDPIGTLFLFFLGFGWAKPVPVNPNNFREGRKDDLKVSLAGVTTNFLLFLFFTLLSIVIGQFLYPEQVRASKEMMTSLLHFDSRLFALQLYPEYAGYLEGIVRSSLLLHFQRFVLQSSMINLGLCLFNLLPIPPLDGFHVFNDILLRGRLRLNPRAFQIAQAALFVLLFATDIIGRFISAVLTFVQGNVLQTMLRLF